MANGWAEADGGVNAREVQPRCRTAAAVAGARPNQMLVGAVAPSSAARQGLLAEYVVATDEDRTNGLKMPTVAMWSLLSGLNC